MRTSSILALLSLSLLLFSAGAAAQESAGEDAEALLVEGIGQRRDGHLEEALRTFYRAHRVERSPRALVQIALTEAQMERWVAAYVHMTRALSEAEDGYIQEHRAELEGAMATIRPHVDEETMRQNVEALLVEAIDMRQEGHLEEALRLFRRAYSVERSPRALVQLGLTEAQAERWVVAERHISTALEIRDDEYIQRQRSALEAAALEIRRHLGNLALVGGPRGGQVLIDGEAHGTLPTPPLRVAIGDHQLRVEGVRESFERAITIEAGGTLTVEVNTTLEATDPAPVAGAEPDMGLLIGGGASLAVGIGLVLLGAASGAIVQDGNANEDFQYARRMTPLGENTCANTNPDVMALAQSSCDAFGTFEPLQYVGYIAGSLAVGAGVALFVLAFQGGEAEDEPVSLLPSFGPGGASLQLNARW